MRYRVKVWFAYECPPVPWDAEDGVASDTYDFELGVSGVTLGNADERALSEHSEASDEAVPLGIIDGVSIYVDGLGTIWATDPDVRGHDTSTYNEGPLDPREEDGRRKLSARTWRKVNDRLFLRAQPIYKPIATWQDEVLVHAPFWRRLLNKLLRRRCGNCLYFDARTAYQWRTQVTHTFMGEMKASMWDDITKVAAQDVLAPDFREGEMGFCPQAKRALSARLEVCDQYRRAKKLVQG